MNYSNRYTEKQTNTQEFQKQMLIEIRQKNLTLAQPNLSKKGFNNVKSALRTLPLNSLTYQNET